MNYQITCPCGHTFQRSEEELKGGSIPCPACARPLSVVIQPAGGPASVAAAPVATEPTKRCPFCGEVILAIARKCKHCGEFLDRADPGGSALSSSGTVSQAISTTPAASDEPVYSLTVSQWDNFWQYLILVTIVLVVSAITLTFSLLRVYAGIAIPATMVFAGFIAWFFYLHAKNTRIYIRPMRIDIEKGILSRRLESLELFRINDTELKQGFAERIVGIGTIKLMSTDSDDPVMTLYQIPRAREVLKYLQSQIPIAAKQRGAVYMEK